MRPIVLSLLPFMVLSACGASPAPEFRNATRHEVNRDGRNYVVFHSGNRAEVIRLGYAYPGQHRAIRHTMTALLEEVTGCKILPITLQGDSGEMRTTLRCPQSEAPAS